MKLNLFSPLPPATTRSARWIWHLLPALVEQAEVTLWTVQDDWDAELERLAPVRRCEGRDFWARVNEADMSVYHLGGCPEHHSHLWQLMRLHPGVAVLFDLHFHDLVTGTYEYLDDADGLRRTMVDQYGEEGRQEAERILREGRLPGTIPTSMTFVRCVLETVLGVAVPSRSAFKALEGQQPWPLAELNLPFVPAAHSLSAKDVGRVRRLVICGDCWLTRPIPAVLDALSRLPEPHLFQLDVFGRLWPQSALPAHSRELGLSEQVRFHETASQEEVSEALARADLAINLRESTFGEASFTQLLSWERSVPTLVTRAGWFAELPEDAVAFVEPGGGSEPIRAFLQSLLDEPERWRRMGRRGRERLGERHPPEPYARGLVQLAREAVAFRREAPGRGVAARIATESRDWSPLARDLAFDRASVVSRSLFVR